MQQSLSFFKRPLVSFWMEFSNQLPLERVTADLPDFYDDEDIVDTGGKSMVSSVIEGRQIEVSILLRDVNDRSDTFSFLTVRNNVQNVGVINDSLNNYLGFKSVHDVVVDEDVLINESDGFAIVGGDGDDFVRSHFLADKSSKFESSFDYIDLAKNVSALNHEEEFYI